MNLTLKNSMPKVANPVIITSIPNPSTYFVGDTLLMIVTVTSRNGNWLRLSSNTFSPIPRIGATQKNQIVTTVNYVFTCADVNQSPYFYTIRAVDSNCVNQLRSSLSLSINVRNRNMSPKINIWNPQLNKYISNTSNPILFDATSEFCISVAGIDTVTNQKLSMEILPQNFGNTSLYTKLLPNEYLVKYKTDTAFFKYCLPSCTQNRDSLYRLTFRIKSENTCAGVLLTTLGVLLKSTTTQNSLPTIQTSLPNPHQIEIGNPINMVVTITSKNNNWISYTTNTTSILPTVGGFGKTKIVTTVNYVFNCNDLVQNPIRYTIMAKDSNCVNKLSNSFEQIINLKKTQTAPNLKIWDAAKQQFVSTLNAINFDGKKDFCLSFTGSDIFDAQTLQLNATQTNTPVLSNYTIYPNNYLLKSANDTAKFSFCFVKCFQNQDSIIDLNFILNSDAKCFEGNTSNKNIKFKNMTNKNSKPLITTNFGAENTKNFYVENSLELGIKVVSSDSNWVSLKTFSNSSIPAFQTKNSNEINQLATYTFQCQDRAKSPFEYKIIATDSNCYAQNADTLTLKINVIDSSFVVSEITNIITPNGDGRNDTFDSKYFPKSNCEEKFEKIEIYNRWGSVVHRTTELNELWDASNSPDGLYFYVITYTTESLNGWIQVLR